MLGSQHLVFLMEPFLTNLPQVLPFSPSLTSMCQALQIGISILGIPLLSMNNENTSSLTSMFQHCCLNLLIVGDSLIFILAFNNQNLFTEWTIALIIADIQLKLQYFLSLKCYKSFLKYKLLCASYSQVGRFLSYVWKHLNSNLIISSIRIF